MKLQIGSLTKQDYNDVIFSFPLKLLGQYELFVWIFTYK